MRTSIVVGSRGSRLALIQTESVVAKIREVNPCLEVSIRRIVTAGDRDHHTRLDRIGVAVFVKELEEALLDNRIDIAVHSLKDVPTEIPSGLRLLAVTERLDPRDVLVARSRLDDLPVGSRIGTGSLRRSVQVSGYRPGLVVDSIRGNVDTRLRKVYSGEFDGVILAAAAVLRSGWEDKVTQYLDLEHFLPAVGQGALVVEARCDDKEMTDMVSPINHLPTWQSVAAERAFLRALGGGCRAPIAALGTVDSGKLKLRGMVADASTGRALRAQEEGDAGLPEEVGVRLARKMIGMGAADFVARARWK